MTDLCAFELDADLELAKLRVQALPLWRRAVLSRERCVEIELGYIPLNKEKANMTDVLICGSDDISVDMGYPSPSEFTTTPDGYWDDVPGGDGYDSDQYSGDDSDDL